MKVGFSTLALFMKPIEEILEIGKNDRFELIEILTEGFYNPEYLLKNKEMLEPFQSYDYDYYLHAPTVDLNLASINPGIRKESVRQTLKALELGNEIGAKAVTIHPGQIGRIEDRIRNMGLKLSKESIKECVKYSEGMETKISVENMPGKPKFLCTKPEELENIVEETNCSITIDLGHANTCNNTEKFLDIPNIAYCHLSDNNGEKDQHNILGQGTLDLNLLKKVKNGILELNNYNKVLESKKVLEKMNL